MKILFTVVSFMLLLTAQPSLAANKLKTGVYTGKFGTVKASIFIDKISGSQVTGRSLYLQNMRPLSGQLIGGSTLVLNEPGDKKGDGSFAIILTEDGLQGSWRPYPNKINQDIKAKEFTFKASDCKFQAPNPKDFIGQASVKKLGSEDLMMSAMDLDYLRNGIYARHGYSFAKSEVAEWFAEDKAYTPCYFSVEDQLSPLEKENIRRIKLMAGYARKNPDQFGR